MTRLIPIILFILSSTTWAVNSPSGSHSADEITKKHEGFSIKCLQVKHKDKVIYEFGAGYGGFQEIIWSPNSRYLAVVEHGIKTIMTLGVYEVSADEVTEIPLPDYHLNILGRFDLFEGGRYWFDDKLVWKNNILTFETRGSLKEGLSDPRNDPDNWYKYRISMRFGGKNTAAQPRLVKVENLSNIKPTKMQNKSQ